MQFVYRKLSVNLIGVQCTVFLSYLEEANVLQSEVCGVQKGLFGHGPPFLSCQLKSHKPLQIVCLFRENPCPASSTD